jgi:hypothetical protein
MHEGIKVAFERFVEQKWRDALNVAAAELVSWEPAVKKPEKLLTERQAGNPKKVFNKGVAAV